MRYPPIGVEGQRRLLASRVLVVRMRRPGVRVGEHAGAAGVGQLRIVDRDFLEMNNLQRQVLYDEADVAAGLPKAIAAQSRLERINSQIEIEAIVADVDPRNIGQLVRDVDLIVDGTDNFEIGYLLNDAADLLARALGLRGLHRRRGPDHDDPARRDTLFSLSAPGASAARDDGDV